MEQAPNLRLHVQSPRIVPVAARSIRRLRSEELREEVEAEVEVEVEVEVEAGAPPDWVEPHRDWVEPHQDEAGPHQDEAGPYPLAEGADR